MRRLPLLLAALFVTITLTRVATLAFDTLGAGILGTLGLSDALIGQSLQQARGR